MFIKRLGLKNILSFADCSVELRNLNVLIGPNGSGKSNLIHVIELIKKLPGDFVSYMTNSRGADLWLRLGTGVDSGTLEVDFIARELDWRYIFRLGAVGPVAFIQNEEFRNGDEVVLHREPGFVQRNGSAEKLLLRLDFANRSILGMFRGPEEVSVIPDLANNIEKVVVYRDFDTSDRSSLRVGLPAVRGYGQSLVDGGGNLAEILQDLDHHGLMPELNRRLTELNSDAINVRHELRDGRWVVTLEERGLSRRLPGAVLSDGTLRFLCLAAILMHPSPPPLICVEEPEYGLHPDAIRIVGDMILEAATKTQVIVTTHSAELVDCFTSEPDTVLVCEKGFDNETTIRRFGRDELRSWLDEFTLGDLWKRGVLGGTRW